MMRLALVGCGAVAEKSWAPALAASDTCRVAVCVDVDRERAAALAARFPDCKVATEWGSAAAAVDAAILALPHHLHAEAGVVFLSAGCHVLVEKPLAQDRAGAARLVDAARATSARLVVAQVRRFLPAYRFVKEAITAGLLGEVAAVRVEEGSRYGWPIVSDAQLRRDSAGGGVLFDTGAHVVDALGWWLGGLRPLACTDDAAGGIEAESEVAFEYSGGKGEIRFSRLRELANRIELVGSGATLEIDCFGRWGRLRNASGSVLFEGRFECPDEPSGTVALFQRQFEVFERVIRDGADSDAVTGEVGAATVEFLLRCYEQRVPRRGIWQTHGMAGGAR